MGFAIARGLTAEAAAALWRPLSFRRVEAIGTSFGFGWCKWQALAQSIVAALADYHKDVPDSAGLEQDRLRRALEMRLPVPAFAAAAFRDRIGTGRKLAIQILEYFDRTGMTIREGDLRRLREDRLETLKGAGD